MLVAFSSVGTGSRVEVPAHDCTREPAMSTRRRPRDQELLSWRQPL